MLTGVVYRGPDIPTFPGALPSGDLGWRLGGQSLPEGSVPVRFVLPEKAEMELHDIVPISRQICYEENLSKATAQAIACIAWADERWFLPKTFWEEYLGFAATHFTSVIPYIIRFGAKRDGGETGRIDVLETLVKAGADVNALLFDQTALDYLVNAEKTWARGEAPHHLQDIAGELKRLGAINVATEP